MIKNLIQILKNDNISISKNDIDNFEKNLNSKDAIYPKCIYF